ncbi:MAG: DUF58 domain-containing protein [Thermomicrobiales bacterium]
MGGAGFGGGDGEPLFTEAFLAQLRRLTVQSRSTLSAGLVGEHRSRRRGSSPEFADFKRYSPGDDFRRIDWNTYARLDTLFVRMSEVTTELDIHLLIDASASMDWRGGEAGPTKLAYAQRLAGTIGYVALWHFDRVALTPFGAETAVPFGPAQGRNQAVPLLRFAGAIQGGGTTDVARVLSEYGHRRRRPGILVLISDLLSGDPEDLVTALRWYRAHGWHASVLQVMDPAELDPAAMLAAGGRSGAAELVDVEDGGRLLVVPGEAVLARYRASMGTWLASLESVCREEHVEYVRLQTDWPVETLVAKLLRERGILG